MEKPNAHVAAPTAVGDADPSIDTVIRDASVFIVYQPVVDLRTQLTLGHEALVRSRLPAFAQPQALFAQAKARGRTADLGRLLRKLAIQGCADTPLFLNLVPQEFDDGLLLDPADPIFTHTQQVYLEITESLPVQYFALCHDILNRARAQGLRVVIDDFGAGYSNLQYIADLEPHLVKLDRQLVSGLSIRSRRFQLVEHIVRLCSEMGAEVVAEGIESSEELQAAIDAGVHYGQGYLFARPNVPPPAPTWPNAVRKQSQLRAVARPQRPIFCIDNAALGPFLDRRRRRPDSTQEVNLNAILTNILERANAFVPSAAGTIFLNDPTRPGASRAEDVLLFVACFGESAEELLGNSLPASKGIVGRVYTSGLPHMSADPHHDQFFYPGIDAKTHYKTQSVLCVPLRLEREVIGAIQLLNRLNERDYNRQDLGLLEIFAQTIASSISNAVDAQHAVELARRDDLSGLYNDRYLHTRLREVIGAAAESGDDCGLLFLDLDNFKQVNDTYGHLVGSSILRELGFIMRRILPPTAIASRYGGDEFVVIVPGTPAEEARRIADRLRQTIEAHVFAETADPLDPESLPALALSGVITASVGVATLRAHVLPLVGEASPLAWKTKLLELADAAMYLAKESGKNRVCVAP